MRGEMANVSAAASENTSNTCANGTRVSRTRREVAMTARRASAASAT